MGPTHVGYLRVLEQPRKCFRFFGLGNVLELKLTVLPYRAWRKLFPSLPFALDFFFP
jgi:hypothetical protein